MQVWINSCWLVLKFSHKITSHNKTSIDVQLCAKQLSKPCVLTNVHFHLSLLTSKIFECHWRSEDELSHVQISTSRSRDVWGIPKMSFLYPTVDWIIPNVVRQGRHQTNAQRAVKRVLNKGVLLHYKIYEWETTCKWKYRLFVLYKMWNIQFRTKHITNLQANSTENETKVTLLLIPNPTRIVKLFSNSSYSRARNWVVLRPVRSCCTFQIADSKEVWWKVLGTPERCGVFERAGAWRWQGRIQVLADKGKLFGIQRFSSHGLVPPARIVRWNCEVWGEFRLVL